MPWARRITWLLPLFCYLVFSIEPLIRISGRIDDGNYGVRTIVGNGLALVWAPEGPGWPNDSKGYSWHQATEICAHLQDDGLSLSDSALNIWRLPTIAEAVASQVRHNMNAGGVWEEQSGTASYHAAKPDKESPLWKHHSPVIYWWTATAGPDTSTAYRIVYNGQVHALPKKIRMGDFSFRAVKSAPPR
ncbi:MAG: hypothetical protein IPL65_10825 [Lewinellaceae bacterium]|nr:hypothetical protein [Lewinellaceae bacterium]